MWAHWTILGNVWHFWEIQALQGSLETVGLFGHFQAVWALFNKLSTSCHIWPYWPKMPKLPKIAQKCPIAKGVQDSKKMGVGGYNCHDNFYIFKGKNVLSSNDHFLFILGLGEDDGVK